MVTLDVIESRLMSHDEGEVMTEGLVESLGRRLDEFENQLDERERRVLRAIVEASAPPLDRARRDGVDQLLDDDERALLEELARQVGSDVPDPQDGGRG